MHLSRDVLTWLADVRSFTPDDLGFEWLMTLVRRGERRYHDFAVLVMTRSFVPADFAVSPNPSADIKSGKVAKTDAAVDLKGETFVFTGKLATMSRGEAQAKVTDAGGANSNSVTKKLDYLVIGDEGSPLYGEGRKGSKQLKGEKLIADGSAMRIISETAFLQRLAGEQREFAAGDAIAGCERLWSMMVDPESARDPAARFAMHYFRRHHPEIGLKETDRPVDPGAEIPAEFLTADRVLPLMTDHRAELREFALDLAEHEFARWQPGAEALMAMCGAKDEAVRAFVTHALTCEDSPEHRRVRVDPASLTPEMAYAFCEAKDDRTRSLGMWLIEQNPRFGQPEELFRLTESPDAKVRAFVLRGFWSMYRDRGIRRGWSPSPRPEKSTVGIKKKPRSEAEILAQVGPGPPPRPPSPPAGSDPISGLLRRVLFELPPGRPGGNSESSAGDSVQLRRLPARVAKLNLIETVTQLAIEDRAFADAVTPVLKEFLGSRGKSEQAACLVAVTRIEHSRIGASEGLDGGASGPGAENPSPPAPLSPKRGEGEKEPKKPKRRSGAKGSRNHNQSSGVRGTDA